jgi:hypothetical protein
VRKMLGAGCDRSRARRRPAPRPRDHGKTASPKTTTTPRRLARGPSPSCPACVSIRARCRRDIVIFHVTVTAARPSSPRAVSGPQGQDSHRSAPGAIRA